ncbi:MAG TPA: hypothetical protein VJK48_06140 [Chlamydiales bacterium]|nr:hypothetical protein [Chlamydiales bacterium]
MSSKILLVFFLSLYLAAGFTQEPELTGRASSSYRGKGAASGYGSRDATALSIMGWGLGLGIGIATLCALIPNNTSSNEHNGSSSH